MNKSVSILWWLLLAFCGTGRLKAQTILEPQLPSQGLVQQQQLWNILVVNNGDAINMGMIQLVFQEEGSGKKIFTAASGALFIPRGASQLGIKDMGAVRYDYLSPLYRDGSAAGGLLPIGHFIACYHLLDVKSGQLIAQNCLPLSVEPFSPPQLAYPADKSDVTTNYPVFNWIAPAPVSMFSNLSYKLIVTEIKNGQTPGEAIQHNPMLFIQSGIKDMSLPYPASYTALQAGKSYAWQIMAQNDNTWSAATDIWRFRVREDTLSVVLDKAAYPHLQRGPGNTHFVVQQKIKFSYDNEANDSSLTATVFANTAQGNATLFTRVLTFRRGMNFVDFTLDGTRGMQRGREYVLELVNSRNENWDLRFRYEPAN